MLVGGPLSPNLGQKALVLLWCSPAHPGWRARAGAWEACGETPKASGENHLLPPHSPLCAAPHLEAPQPGRAPSPRWDRDSVLWADGPGRRHLRQHFLLEHHFFVLPPALPLTLNRPPQARCGGADRHVCIGFTGELLTPNQV